MPDRLLELESLRGIAATSILVFHCWLFTSHGVFNWGLGPLTVFMQPLQSGVTLFLVLSGFLLYRPIVHAVVEGRPRQSATTYLRNRALRILPAYWFVLLVSGFVLQSATTDATSSGIIPGTLTDPRSLASNLLLVQTYHPSTIWTGVLPAWSLTVELAFYLCIPLLALLAAGLIRHRSVAWAVFAPMALLLLFGVTGKTLVTVLSDGPERSQGADWHAVLDRSLLTHADLFAFGMAAAVALVLWNRRPDGPPKFIGGASTGRFLAYLGLPTLIVGYYLIPPYLYDSLVAFFAAVLLLRLLSKSRDGTKPGLLTHRRAVAWGRVSYSVFLWNWPVLSFLAVQGLLASGSGPLPFLRNLIVASALVGALSFFTYRFVEAPALTLKGRGSQLREGTARPARASA